jgi:hypothetical protein
VPRVPKRLPTETAAEARQFDVETRSWVTPFYP